MPQEIRKDSKRVPNALALALLLVHFILAFSSVQYHSLTIDEHAHLPAGISYLKKRDPRLNPEHPPLSKVVAAIPTLFMRIHWDDLNLAWVNAADWITTARTQGINAESRDRIFNFVMCEWSFGETFLYALNRDNLSFILAWTRVPLVLLSVFAGWIIYVWAGRCFGSQAALFAVAFYAFSPDLLAHAPLVTTDVCYTLFNTLTLFSLFSLFSRNLASGREARFKDAAFLAASLAGLLLTKYSGLMMPPFMAGALVLAALLQPRDERMGYLKEKAFSLVAAVLGACLLVLIFYWALFGELTYITGFQIVSKKILFNPGINFYLMGEARRRFPSYFLVAGLVKTTIPALILLGVWAGIMLRKKLRAIPPPIALLLLFSVYFFALITFTFPQAGVRYMLPLWPVAFMLLGHLYSMLRAARAARWVLWGLAAAHALAALAAFPNYISYMNALTLHRGKPYYLSDSNLDWGQDLPALRRYQEARGLGQIRLLPFGFADPAFYGVNAVPFKLEGLATSPSGTIAAISVFHLQWMAPKDRVALGQWRLLEVLNDTIYVYKRD